MLILPAEKSPQDAAGTALGEFLEIEGPAGFGSLHQFAESLGNAVDAKDPLTFNHSQEVALISQALAQTSQFDPAVVDVLAATVDRLPGLLALGRAA